MELAEATAEIVSAEREYHAALEEFGKAERYVRECKQRVEQARVAGLTTYAACGPRLACGHVAAPSERLRSGPDAWCSECCKWEPKV